MEAWYSRLAEPKNHYMQEMVLAEFKQTSRDNRLFQIANGVEPTTITAETRFLTNRLDQSVRLSNHTARENLTSRILAKFSELYNE